MNIPQGENCAAAKFRILASGSFQEDWDGRLGGGTDCAQSRGDALANLDAMFRLHDFDQRGNPVFGLCPKRAVTLCGAIPNDRSTRDLKLDEGLSGIERDEASFPQRIFRANHSKQHR